MRLHSLTHTLHASSSFFPSSLFVIQVFVVVFSSAYLLRKYSSTGVNVRVGRTGSAAAMQQHGSSWVAGDSVSSRADSHGHEGSRGGEGSRALGGDNYDGGHAAAGMGGGDPGRTGSEATRGRVEHKMVTFKTVSEKRRHDPN